MNPTDRGTVFLARSSGGAWELGTVEAALDKVLALDAESPELTAPSPGHANAAPFAGQRLSDGMAMPDLLVFRSRERIAEAGCEVEPRYGRRLSDQVTASFYEACRIGNLDAAGRLVQALEWVVACSTLLLRADVREDGDDLAAVHARYELETSRREKAPEPGRIARRFGA